MVYTLVSELAKKLGITRQKIYHAIVSGKLIEGRDWKEIEIVKTQIVVREDSVISLLNKE